MNLLEKLRAIRGTRTSRLESEVEFARDNAVRQYLHNKNLATHYQHQANLWLETAQRHRDYLESKEKCGVGRIEELAKNESL